MNKTIILQKSQADSFVVAMEDLGRKFNYRLLPGKIEDYVKLTIENGNVDLEFVRPVPEMVRVACYIAFVETLL